MKKFGLIGGVGPESTIAYYRLIIKKFLKLSESNSYPDFLIKNVDMNEMIEYVVNQNYDKLVTFLINATNDMEKAGVDFGAIASNTPHIVYDKLIDKINLPMISIVEEACKAAQTMNIKKIGLFGTKSTMTNGFYQKTADRFGLDIVTPSGNEIDYIHDKYMNELIFNDIRVETKDGLIQIVNNLQNKHSIEGLILGGTELSLILSQKDFENIQLLDSAIIHVDAIVNKMMGN
jgi:aspartate racemase